MTMPLALTAYISMSGTRYPDRVRVKATKGYQGYFPEALAFWPPSSQPSLKALPHAAATSPRHVKSKTKSGGPSLMAVQAKANRVPIPKKKKNVPRSMVKLPLVYSSTYSGLVGLLGKVFKAYRSIVDWTEKMPVVFLRPGQSRLVSTRTVYHHDISRFIFTVKVLL